MRKNIRLLLCLAVSIFSVTPAVSALEVGGQQINIGLTDAYVSRYIWRGQDLFAGDDGANQPSIDVSLPDSVFGADASFNIWASLPIQAGHQSAEEIDYSFTLSRDILDQAINLSAGYVYFNFPHSGRTADIQEPWLSLTLNQIPILPIAISTGIFAGYDFKVKSGGPNQGWYYAWDLGTEFALPKTSLTQEGQTLSLGAVNWGNDGVADLKSSVLYATEFSLSTGYSLVDFSITPSINYSMNHESQINNGDDEIWGGIEISRAF